MKNYIEFLKDKMAISHQSGFEVSAEELTPFLYPHVKDTIHLRTPRCIGGMCYQTNPSCNFQERT